MVEKLLRLFTTLNFVHEPRGRTRFFHRLVELALTKYNMGYCTSFSNFIITSDDKKKI